MKLWHIRARHATVTQLPIKSSPIHPIHSVMLLLGWLVILSLSATTFDESALAWETYGHEQIQNAAVHLLDRQEHPLAKLFNANLDTLKKLAVVPDASWRQSGKPNKPTFREEGLHYFEVDAFLRFGTSDNAILTLPSDDYPKAYAKYQALLRDNVMFVLEFDRNQNDPSAYGTAPWRVLQIYDLAVGALRDRKTSDALFYLGLLSHYVGDLAEPLNTTLNYDGRHYPIPATGVYVAFERGIFENTSDESIIPRAAAALGGKGLDGLTRARVIPELLRLIDSGYWMAHQLIEAFSKLCGHAHGRAIASVSRDREQAIAGKKGTTATPSACEPSISAAASRQLVRGFAETDLADKQGPITVRDAAATRLGEAAALTARFWAAAFNEAGRPALPQAMIPFESLKNVERYFTPNYRGQGLPGLHDYSR